MGKLFFTNAGLVILLVAYLMLVSVIAQDIGLTTAIIEPPPDDVDAPDGGIFDALIGLSRWVFNSIGSFLQILTFQVEVPTFINTLIILPITFGFFWLILALVRGGAS